MNRLRNRGNDVAFVVGLVVCIGFLTWTDWRLTVSTLGLLIAVAGWARNK